MVETNWMQAKCAYCKVNDMRLKRDRESIRHFIGLYYFLLVSRISVKKWSTVTSWTKLQKWKTEPREWLVYLMHINNLSYCLTSVLTQILCYAFLAAICSHIHHNWLHKQGSTKSTHIFQSLTGRNIWVYSTRKTVAISGWTGMWYRLISNLKTCLKYICVVFWGPLHCLLKSASL